MGVRTTADENRDLVRDLISKFDIEPLKDIEDALSGVIDPLIWGSEHWSEDFKEQVDEDINMIWNIIRQLKKLKRRYE